MVHGPLMGRGLLATRPHEQLGSAHARVLNPPHATVDIQIFLEKD